MRYIYAEEFLAVNVAANAAMILCAIKARRKKVHWGRLIAASSLGATYALCALLWPESLDNLPAKAASLAGMGTIVCKPFSAKGAALNSALILCASFVSSGCVLFVVFLGSSMASPLSASIHASYPIVVGGFAIGCLGTAKLYGMLLGSIEGIDFSKAWITVGSNRARAQLLNDTGNRLRGPTGAPVLVLNPKLFGALTGLQDTVFFDSQDFVSFCEALEDEEKDRVIPLGASTVNGTCILVGYRADEARFLGEIAVSPVYLACSQTRMEGFDGIYNKSALWEKFHDEAV